jgi:hypothetical protein
MTPALLGLGLMFGIRHAFEPDHVASVASLCTRSTALRDAVTIAAAWGVGHGTTVLVAGAALRVLGLSVPPWLTVLLECAVGVVLLVLGLEVLHRWSGQRRPSAPAVMAPALPGSLAVRPVLLPPAASAARRQGSALWRALVIGSLHGLAGTSVLMVVVVPTLPSSSAVLGYLGLFGLGGTLGMMICTLVIYLPVRRAGGGLRMFPAVVGVMSVAVGAWVAVTALRAGG